MTADNSPAQAFTAFVGEAEPMPVDDAIHARAEQLGPDSLIWKFYGDWRLQLFGFQRIAGCQNSVDQLGQAVQDHSVVFTDTWGRAKRTAAGLMTALYDEDALTHAKRVRDFHRDVKGTVGDGSRYHAMNPELYYWGHATFVDQILYITDTFIRRLSEQEKRQIFEESKIWYSMYGVSARNQPQTYEEFQRYFDSMVERFVPHPTIVYATGYLRKGVPGPAFVPKPIWKVLSAPLNAYLRTVVVGTMPPRMRENCRLPWSDRHQRNFERFTAGTRALNPVLNRLPVRVLYTPWAARAYRHAEVDPRKILNNPTES
ncbi:oxygenase MpaB family protein [Nocardia huaxiensis]|uniref:oxygenase MpaB family protein n=1 Tax=Nocardia huaxiensis TaxID=2755382 RepID=UPI003B8A6DF7